MASRDQVRQRLLCRLAQANRVLEMMIVGTRDGEAKHHDDASLRAGDCDDELLLAEAATDVRVDASALLQAAQDVWNDAVLWEQAAWETYWNCESP
jgi:hypothetical protein